MLVEKILFTFHFLFRSVETCEPAILGFLLDISKTTRGLHDREIKIIKGIVNRFDVRDGGSQAGLVTFDDYAITRAAVGEITQEGLFSEMLDTISHTSRLCFHSIDLLNFI